MPTYAYRCSVCGHSFDVHQSFSDAALTQCPQCDGLLRKVFSTPAVSFKGSGFYLNDSKKSASSSAPSSSSGSTSK